ncbi:MAG: Trp family transcriptional regulator [Desulfobacterium sp.]|nr:Trp family transcriptional regulator [Desulfobacterium sp.]
MKVEKELLKVIASIAEKKDNLEELDLFFQEIFTPGELADLSLRWKLLTDLNQGMTQRRIAEKYSISLCKITRGSKILKKKNSIVLKILKNNGEKSEI